MKRLFKKSWYGIVWGTFYALIAIPLAVLMSVLAKTHPFLTLLFVGTFSLLNYFISRRKVTAFFASNTLFLPFVYPLMFADYVGEIGSNMWQILIGELIVVSWISGIIYILLAIVARFISLKNYRRVFPPYIIGALLVLLGLSLFIRLGYDQALVPLVQQRNVVPLFSVLIGSIVAVFVRLLTKPTNFFHRTFILVGLLFAVGSTFAFEAIAVALGQIYFLDTSVYYPLSNLTFNLDLIPLFDQPDYYFNYLDNLYFSTDLILFILPVTMISFSKLFEDIVHQKHADGEKHHLENDIDEILLSNGLSLMISNLGGASFVTSVNHHEIKSKKGSRFIALFILFVFTVLFGLSSFANQIIEAIPLAVYSGIAMAVALLFIVYGIKIFLRSRKENPGKKNTVIFIATLLAGLPCLGFDIYEHVTTERLVSFQIETVHLNYLFIALMVGILFNMVLIRKKKVVPLSHQPQAK